MIGVVVFEIIIILTKYFIRRFENRVAQGTIVEWVAQVGQRVEEEVSKHYWRQPEGFVVPVDGRYNCSIRSSPFDGRMIYGYTHFRMS